MLARRKTHNRAPQEIAEALEFAKGHPAAAAHLLGLKPWIVRNSIRTDPALAHWRIAANRSRRLKFRLGPVPKIAGGADPKPAWPDFADRRLAVLINAIGKKEAQRILEHYLSGVGTPLGAAQTGMESETWSAAEKRVDGALKRSNGNRLDACRELDFTMRRLKDTILRTPALRRRWATQVGVADIAVAGAVRTMLKLPSLADRLIERLGRVQNELLSVRTGVLDDRRAKLLQEEADLSSQLCALGTLQGELNRMIKHEMARMVFEKDAVRTKTTRKAQEEVAKDVER